MDHSPHVVVVGGEGDGEMDVDVIKSEIKYLLIIYILI